MASGTEGDARRSGVGAAGGVIGRVGRRHCTLKRAPRGASRTTSGRARGEAVASPQSRGDAEETRRKTVRIRGRVSSPEWDAEEAEITERWGGTETRADPVTALRV
jgi:hypothetical protein